MNIFHAGGKIDEDSYTNSYESIISNIEKVENYDQKIFFELDVVAIKDAFVIAHNNMEDIYDCDKNIRDVTLEEYNKLKVCGKYTPMNFQLLENIMNKYSNVVVVLDIKESRETYSKILSFIRKNLNNISNNLIPQVYEEYDILECQKYEFKTCMIGMWKNYDNIFANRSINFIQSIQKLGEKSDINIMGITIDHKHANNENFKEIKQYLNFPIYFHNQPSTITPFLYCMYNSAGVFFFI